MRDWGRTACCPSDAETQPGTAEGEPAVRGSISEGLDALVGCFLGADGGVSRDFVSGGLGSQADLCGTVIDPSTYFLTESWP